MRGAVVVYGVTGYLGPLVLAEAVARGLKPLLGGRHGGRLLAVAARFGLDARTAAVTDDAALAALLADAAVLLNLAGPFSETAAPLIAACLKSGTHYLDVANEIGVLEFCAARDEEARRAGIMVMPGCGFDVVPSDCLAAHLGRALGRPQSLAIAIRGVDKVSRTTLKMMIDGLGRATPVRRDGKIVHLKRPPVRAVDFGEGPTDAIAVGWGDVATAFHSTGAPNIECYLEGTADLKRRIRRIRRWGWLFKGLGTPKRTPGRGPSRAARLTGRSVFVAEALDAEGRRVRARLETPESYTVTAATAAEIARRVLSGEGRPGFQTPSRIFGADFILGFPGVRRQDLAH